MLDFLKRNQLGREEFRYALLASGQKLSEEEFEELWCRVDLDGSGLLKFYEFLEFLLGSHNVNTSVHQYIPRSFNDLNHHL